MPVAVHCRCLVPPPYAHMLMMFIMKKALPMQTKCKTDGLKKGHLAHVLFGTGFRMVHSTCHRVFGIDRLSHGKLRECLVSWHCFELEFVFCSLMPQTCSLKGLLEPSCCQARTLIAHHRAICAPCYVGIYSRRYIHRTCHLRHVCVCENPAVLDHGAFNPGPIRVILVVD